MTLLPQVSVNPAATRFFQIDLQYASPIWLVDRVLQAYFDVITGQDNVELFWNKKALIKKQLRASQSKFEVGTLINLDVLNALDALFTTRVTLNKARYNTILNALRLKV